VERVTESLDLLAFSSYMFFITTTQVICIFYSCEVINAGSDSDARKFNNKKKSISF